MRNLCGFGEEIRSMDAILLIQQILPDENQKIRFRLPRPRNLKKRSEILLASRRHSYALSQKLLSTTRIPK